MKLTSLLKKSTSKPSLLIVVVMALFLPHAVEIMIYAIYFYVSDFSPSLEGKEFGVSGDSFNAVYLSILSYSSLGFSSIQPEGTLRLVSGFEALNGLLLITWSASFMFLAMGKLWDCEECVIENKPDNKKGA